jgi:hypothetical protein
MIFRERYSRAFSDSKFIADINEKYCSNLCKCLLRERINRYFNLYIFILSKIFKIIF